MHCHYLVSDMQLQCRERRAISAYMHLAMVHIIACHGCMHHSRCRSTVMLRNAGMRVLGQLARFGLQRCESLDQLSSFLPCGVPVKKMGNAPLTLLSIAAAIGRPSHNTRRHIKCTLYLCARVQALVDASHSRSRTMLILQPI